MADRSRIDGAAGQQPADHASFLLPKCYRTLPAATKLLPFCYSLATFRIRMDSAFGPRGHPRKRSSAETVADHHCTVLLAV